MSKSKLILSGLMLSIISAAGTADTYQPHEPVIDCATAYPTRDKPQSKLWHAYGVWWAWLPYGGTGSRLWRRDAGGAWSPETGLDSALSLLPGRADVWASEHGENVVAALVEDSLLAVVSLGWNPHLGGYELKGRPIRWRAGSTVETITIDRQSEGHFWVAYPEDLPTGIRIVTRKIDPAGAQFGPGEPVILAEGLYQDEICAVCALGNGSVGVIWSDQNAEALFFRKHAAEAADSVWSTADTVAAGNKTADDHLNFCRPPAGSGPVFLAATKTSLDSVGLPLLSLRVLGPKGRWHSIAFAPLYPDHHPSRPIVIWNGTYPVCLYTVYGPGDRLYGMNSLMLQAFSGDGLRAAGPPRVVIPALNELNDVTGPKREPPGTACLILVSDNRGRVYEAFIEK